MEIYGKVWLIKVKRKKVTMGTPHIDTELEKLCMFAIFKESIIKELQHKVLWVHVGNQGRFKR